MKDIINLIQDVIDSYGNIKIKVNKHKIVLYRNFIFRIVISNNNEKELNIYYDWRIGIFGKLIFGNDYRAMLNILKEIKDVLSKKGFIVFTTIKN